MSNYSLIRISFEDVDLSHVAKLEGYVDTSEQVTVNNDTFYVCKGHIPRFSEHNLLVISIVYPESFRTTPDGGDKASRATSMFMRLAMNYFNAQMLGSESVPFPTIYDLFYVAHPNVSDLSLESISPYKRLHAILNQGLIQANKVVPGATPSRILVDKESAVLSFSLDDMHEITE